LREEQERTRFQWPQKSPLGTRVAQTGSVNVRSK
jgi:hypothetical protein